MVPVRRSRPPGLTYAIIFVPSRDRIERARLTRFFPRANIFVLRNSKVKAIRLSTLDAVCRALEYQPGDILEYKKK